MQRRRWSEDERAEAVRLVAEVGHAEAARRTGVPRGTVASWAHRAGVTAEGATTATVQAVEARVATIAERKAALAAGLMDDIERLRRDLFAGTIERKVVPGTQHRNTEIVDVRHATTTAGDRNTTVQAIVKAIEAVQLLTGEATARIEQHATVDSRPAERRQRATGVLDELAARRAG